MASFKCRSITQLKQFVAILPAFVLFFLNLCFFFYYFIIFDITLVVIIQFLRILLVNN